MEDVTFHNYSVSVDDQLVGMTEIDVRALDTHAIAELDPEIIDADRIRRSEAYLSRTRRADLSPVTREISAAVLSPLGVA